jgi:hypothetical protein
MVRYKELEKMLSEVVDCKIRATRGRSGGLLTEVL